MWGVAIPRTASPAASIGRAWRRPHRCVLLLSVRGSAGERVHESHPRKFSPASCQVARVDGSGYQQHQRWRPPVHAGPPSVSQRYVGPVGSVRLMKFDDHVYLFAAPPPEQLECATSEGTDSKFARERFERPQTLPATACLHAVSATRAEQCEQRDEKSRDAFDSGHHLPYMDSIVHDLTAIIVSGYYGRTAELTPCHCCLLAPSSRRLQRWQGLIIHVAAEVWLTVTEEDQPQRVRLPVHPVAVRSTRRAAERCIAAEPAAPELAAACSCPLARY